MFESERVAFQYEHNYWKLPVAMDDTSVIHTSGTSLVILLTMFMWNLGHYLFQVLRFRSFSHAHVIQNTNLFHYQQRRNLTSW